MKKEKEVVEEKVVAKKAVVKEVPVDGVKSYDEKVSEYEAHFDALGMQDPSTRAEIAQMKTARPVEVDTTVGRVAGTEKPVEVVEEVEVVPAGEVIMGDEGKTRKEVNEEQSAIVNARQKVDEKETDKKFPPVK